MKKAVKEKSKKYKTFVTVKNTIGWFLVVLLGIAMVIIVVTRINGETPTVFGYTIFRVTTGSMEPELHVGDIILDKSVEESEIKVGDIISYEGSGSLDGLVITHKVIKAPYKDDNGNTMLQTQGIANNTPDHPIKISQVEAKFVAKIPLVNSLYNLFLSPWGLVIFLLLIILIFLDELINFIRVLTGNTKPKADINDIIKRLQEEERLEKEKKKSSEIDDPKMKKIDDVYNRIVKDDSDKK